MELEALDAVLRDQAPRPGDGVRARRVDARERDQHVGVRGGALGDLDDLSLTYYWDWTGFPVVSLPSGVGARSGLPTGVSLVGAPGAEWDLLAWGAGLQAELGTVSP